MGALRQQEEYRCRTITKGPSTEVINGRRSATQVSGKIPGTDEKGSENSGKGPRISGKGPGSDGKGTWDGVRGTLYNLLHQGPEASSNASDPVPVGLAKFQSVSGQLKLEGKT